jgi:hypothetical protein
VNAATAFLQQKLTDAIAANAPLTIEPGVYVIDETLFAVPASGSQHRLNLFADNVRLIWGGAAGQAMLYARGWKNSVIRGLHLDANNGANIVGVDLDTPDSSPSTSGLLWQNCQINFGWGGGGVGWRGSVGGNLYGDVSALVFDNCMVRGLSRSYGDIGWQGLRRNNLAWTWHGGGAVNIATIFSNRNPVGGAQHGGGSMSFYGLVSTSTALDFDFYAGGYNLISGGRYETGKRFLSLGSNAASFAAGAKLDGVNIASYSSEDGILFWLGTAATLSLENCSVNRYGGLDYDARMITANASVLGHGGIRILGGGVQASAPLINLGGGVWKIAVETARLSSSSGAIGWTSG